MRRCVLVLLAAALAAAAAVAAPAGFTPAWSYLPAALRTRLAQASGGPLYLPARTPGFYRYRTGATAAGGVLTVPFTNRVRVRESVWRWTKQTFVWQVRRLPGAATCQTWKTPDTTLQLSGNKVYASSADGVAWRCVTDRLGRMLVLSASATGSLDGAGLGTVVASGLDVSGRTSAVTAVLNVVPRSVRRGGTVSLRGVAGGCTAGDSVTIISHAFAPTHSFAGVPAVFAEVGSAGRFSATARIPATRAPGSYVITARCGGGNLGVAAHLAVTR